jgi:hypothetical protein
MDYRPVLLFVVAAMTLTVGCASDSEDVPAVDLTSSDHVLTDTDELRAGTFTAFADDANLTENLVVGTHPDVATGSIPVEVTELSPEDGAGFGEHADDVAQAGAFYEVYGTEVEEDYLETAPDTGFFYVLPVPSDLDETSLVPMAYQWDRFSHGDIEDGWTWTSGTYDERHDVFVISLATLGSQEHPTRLGLVEHADANTRDTDRVLDTIIGRHLADADVDVEDALPDDGDQRTTASLIAPAASAKDPAEFENRPKHTAEWTLICRTNNTCPSGFTSNVENALDDALDVYVDMNADPRPSIGTNWGSKFMPDKSVYKINIGDDDWHNRCDGEEAPGWYMSNLNRIVICLEAANEQRTAPHELFHSMQYNLATHWAGSDTFVAEGTAEMAEQWNTPAEPSNPNDVPNLTKPLGQESYDTEHFFYHVLEANGLSFADLGDLFDRGIRLDDVQAWVNAKTGQDLGDAYWAFAKDLFYENRVPDPVGSSECTIDENVVDPLIPADRNLTFQPATNASDIPADRSFTGQPIEPMSAQPWRLNLSTDDVEPYRLTVNSTADVFKVYDTHVADWEPQACHSGDLEASGGGSVSIPIYEANKTAYLLPGDRTEKLEDTGNPGTVYNVDFTVEKLPEDEIPYPEASDLAVELPTDAGRSIEIDVLDNASIPDGDDDRLTIVHPGSSGFAASTDENNGYQATAPDGKVEFTVPRGWYGEDTFNYTVEDERTGLTDNGTVTVTRGIPKAEDDRVALNRSTADAWEQESWSIGRADDVDPITVDVLANDDSAMEGAAIGSGNLDIDSATADHGTAEVAFVDSTKTIRYSPDPGGEEAWSSASDGPRHYVDHVTYTAENRAGLSDDAKLTVIYHRPADQEVPGASGTPGGTTCSITGSADGSAGMTLMRGEAPASYVKPAGAESWTEIDAEGTPVAQATRGGHAVGWTVDEEGNTEAFRWSEDEGYQQLDSQGSASFALDVDQRGRAVGAELSPEGRPTAVQWGDERRALDGELEGASMATAIGGSTVAGVQGLTPQGGAGGPSGSLGCGDLGQGPPGGGDDPACPGGRFGSAGPGGTAQGFQGAIGPEGGLGEIVELASDGEGPAVPRDTTRAGASTGMIPQNPSGPTCPTTAMMHTEEGTQTLAPPAGATFSDAFAITERGYAAGLVGTGEARQAAMWAPDGDRAHLDEAIDLREGRSLVAAQAIVDDHLVALVEDDDAGVRPLALGLDRLRTLADTGDPAPLIGDEEETPRFEMEAGSASPGGRITLTLTFVNDDTLADRVEVDLPFEAPVTNEGWEIAATEEPENVEGDFSEATLEAWAESVPAGATVEASATFQVPEDAASTSYEYQALSTTVDGEEIQPTPTATFTVRG